MADITGRVHTADTYLDRYDRGHIIEGWLVEDGQEHHFTLLFDHDQFDTILKDADENTGQREARSSAIDDHDRVMDEARELDGAA